MFEGAGTLYVYRSYGVHWCANIVTGPPGSGEAVLFRGGVPLRGADVMIRRRGRTAPLAIGPGNLCHALAIDAGHDGTSVLRGPAALAGCPSARVLATPRVGISVATDNPWRFVATPRTWGRSEPPCCLETVARCGLPLPDPCQSLPNS